MPRVNPPQHSEIPACAIVYQRLTQWAQSAPDAPLDDLLEQLDLIMCEESVSREGRAFMVQLVAAAVGRCVSDPETRAGLLQEVGDAFDFYIIERRTH